MVSHHHLGTSFGAPASDWLNVITPVEGRPGRYGATLCVDQNHPFFFDHPLDHVPGMLLVTGLLDLLRDHAVLSRDHRVRLSFEFTSMCELGPGIDLSAELSDERGEWTVLALQEDRPVCAGTVALTEEPRPESHEEQGPAVSPAPIEGGLAHRADPRNVLIGEPTISHDGESTGSHDGEREEYVVPLVPPPVGHFLFRHGNEHYGLEEMIEAGRQFATAASHLAHERPRDAVMLWLRLAADLPAAPPRAERLTLRWPTQPPRGNRGTFDLTVSRGTATGQGVPIGSLSYGSRALSPASYQRIRQNGEQE
ncbi:AfsA-related hotdog domain-containing protein [Streptosporangium jomthongense]|uniref:AfsA-related hotdog domain-containing protein n=1 Tax=Streptosporangium jomthongense TaxID=1193683 RepID=A0ABV8EVT0_9ACTN